MTFFGVKTGRFILITSLAVMSFLTKADSIFEENFDGQPDFTSTMHTLVNGQRRAQGDIVPDNWDNIYQGTRWSPETGFPDNHASFEILAANADKTRSGSGKSMVNWRESYNAGWNNFASDSQLQVLLGQEYNELYMEFWISFSANWAGRTFEIGGQSKLARMGYYNGVGDPFNGAPPSNPALGPVLFWDYSQDTYGQRNNFAFRGGPPGYNYNMDPAAAGFEAGTNFTTKTIGKAVGGGNPMVLDQVRGGYLADVDRYDFIFHNQLWGAAGHWTKVGLYVKMNSAPGVNDGLMMQWINDQRIKVDTTVPWIGANPENKMVGWNFISLGGNDFFRPYPNEDRFEDWYAIDDVVVRTSIPEDLLAETPSAPNAPLDISIQ
jgi:hypothetical protein